jgi:hypothetical protein
MDRFVVFGIIGGMLGNLLQLVAIANMKKTDRPSVFQDYWWYVQFVILAAFGGFFVYLYESSITMNTILAVHIGASAPLIAQTLAAHAPSITVAGKTN